MNDKQAPPQIINLFEAMKDTLHANSRSVGDVPAPKRELLHNALGVSAEHARAAAAAHGGGEPAEGADELCPFCGAHWPHDERSELSVKLATSVERNATLALLKKLGGETNNIVARKWLKKAREIIEKGEHVK